MKKHSQCSPNPPYADARPVLALGFRKRSVTSVTFLEGSRIVCQPPPHHHRNEKMGELCYPKLVRIVPSV